MKQFILLLLMFSALCEAVGQDTIPKIREIFDFQVGDIFQYSHTKTKYSSNGPKDFRTYSQEVILKREDKKDTIIYTKELRKKDVNGLITLSMVKDTITDLDSSIFASLKSLLPKSEDKSKYKEENYIGVYGIPNYGTDRYYRNVVRLIEPKSGSIGYSQNFVIGFGMVHWYYNDRAYPADGTGSTYFTYKSFYRKGLIVGGILDDFTIATNERQNEDNNVKLYPNPAVDKVYIEGLEEGSYSIILYDILGNKILKKELKEESFNFPFDLPKGIYLTQILNNFINKPLTIKKIVIQ